MKRLFATLLILFSVAVQAQRISDMPLFTGDGSSAFVPVVIGGVNYKIYGSDLIKSRVGLADTAAMLQNYRHWLAGYLKSSDLAPYLLSSTAVATYQVKGNYALTSQLPTNLNQLTNGPGYITSSALSPYLLSADTANKWQGRGAYLLPADTVNRWQGKGSYATITQLNAKLNITDTGAMLSPYLKTATAATAYATESALSLKAPLADPVFTGTPKIGTDTIATKAYARSIGGGGVGVTDGPKGDIQVTNGGVIWTVKDTVLKGQNFKNDEKDTVGLELLTFDPAPTAGSVNAPTSGSVYNALQGKAPVADPLFTGTVRVQGNSIDTVATQKYVRDNASTKLYDDLDYTSSGVFGLDARQGKQLKGMIDVVTANVGTKAPIIDPQFLGTNVRWGADTVATRPWVRANAGTGSGVTTGGKNQINVVNAASDWQINPNVITPAMLSPAFTTVLNVLDTTITTTNATPATVYSYTPANAEAVTFEVRCEALNTTSSDGLYGAKKARKFLYNGTLTAGTLRDIDANEYVGSSLSAAAFTITTSGSNILVQFTGEASKTIKAHFSISITKTNTP